MEVPRGGAKKHWYPHNPLYKLRPCPSYSRRRDRNNSVHWRSLYKGGGGTGDTEQWWPKDARNGDGVDFVWGSEWTNGCSHRHNVAAGLSRRAAIFFVKYNPSGQPPGTANRQPPTATNRQPPPTANNCSTVLLWSCISSMS